VLVALKTDAYYRTVADEALRSTGVVEPPIAIDAVALRLGVPVRLVRMPAFFSGAAINEDGMPVLLLNSALEDAGRRRYLAHLLGHVIALLDDPEASYPRDARPDHHEADVIASELILPSWVVSEQAAKWFNDHRYLARLFGVTEHEMLAKMRDLGLVRSHGHSLAWDY
jgi:Zn-dependent peptidase ImmA (M78 family)